MFCKKINNYVSNTLYSLLGKAIGMVAFTLLDIFTARLLKTDQYAERAFFFSILNILFFINWFGINASAKVKISQCTDFSKKIACLQATLILRFIVSLVFGILIAFIMSILAKNLGYPGKYPNLRSLFLMSGILTFFNSFTECYKELFIGLEKLKWSFILTSTEYIGYFLFSMLFLLNYNSVYSIVKGYIISGIVVFSIGIVLLRRNYHIFQSIDKSKVNEYIKSIIKYAVPMFLVGIGTAILIEIDTFMIGLYSIKSETAVYSIAKNINSKAAHINYSLAVGTMASFGIIDKEVINEKLKDLKRISIVNCFIIVSVSAILILFSTNIITLLYGVEYRKVGIVLRVLTPYYIMNSIAILYSTFLDFRGKANVRSLAYLSIVLIDIILNYFMIPKWGAIGAAIATSASLAPYTVIIISLTIREYFILTKSANKLNGETDDKRNVEKTNI